MLFRDIADFHELGNAANFDHAWLDVFDLWRRVLKHRPMCRRSRHSKLQHRIALAGCLVFRRREEGRLAPRPRIGLGA